jgi:hypothetical protein
MTNGMTRLTSGPMEPWSFSDWDTSTHVLAEEFLLEGVTIDLSADSICFHLLGEEAAYTPAGRWGVQFLGVSSFDLTRLGPVQDPQHISATIAEHPHYALFSEDVVVHLVAGSASLVRDPSVPELRPDDALGWVVDATDRRAMLLDSSDPADGREFPWDFDADLVYLSIATHVLALRLTKRVSLDSRPPEDGRWMIIEDVESLVAIHRHTEVPRNYVEDMPADERTIYIRLARALLAITRR